MQQVLFYIPVKAGGLPDFFPLALIVFLFFLLIAAGLWFLAPREPFEFEEENVKNFAKWLGGFGAVIAAGMFALSFWWPDGIPVHGFGMMLFIAFLLCNWVAGRRAAGVKFLTIATGPKRGKDYLVETYPAEERNQRAQDLIQDTSVILFIGGLLGARITYLLKDKNGVDSIGDFFVKLPMIWEGGIIFYGSVIGGAVVFAAWYAYQYYYRNIQLSVLKLADIAAPSLALGLCLGRIGCLLNGCCYGQVACAECAVLPVHFPLSAPARYNLVAAGYQTAAGFTLADERDQPRNGVRIGEVMPDSPAFGAGLRAGDLVVKANDKDLVDDTRLASPVKNLSDVLGPDWPRGGKELTLITEEPDPDNPEAKKPIRHTFTPYTIGLHPTQLYESISMFLLFWVLLAFFPLRTRDGQVMVLLMMAYAIHRYLNEILRDDPRPEGFEKYASIALLGLGAILLFWLWTRPPIRAPLAAKRS